MRKPIMKKFYLNVGLLAAMAIATSCGEDSDTPSEQKGNTEISGNTPEATDITVIDRTPKLLVDGRTWNYMLVYFNTPVNDTVFNCISIEGPTEFDGRQCYKRVGTSQEYFYEENSKVYAYLLTSDLRTDNPTDHYGWIEEFNFGIEPGYKETYSDDEMTILIRECKSVDTIIVNGVQRQRYDFGGDVWVEGIGSARSGIYSSWPIVQGNFMGSKLLSVYDGDKCIFTANQEEGF